ncbi:XRE family transcriptional regulator [Myroides odoratimimus]|uniref:XRE family transcriptional regulator n=1 Tax=Myroides odoratimimus TaxID=76832 RepID=UPI002577F109|nr:XRE family transcriptional regulator [Myroides odoratimimus]MDM1494954.1 XRE family transcriptional regulator [Myroides odoratimimus]MDM1505371.1 XRE family transcriptional regulator [Myroides odoratimimus]MDM1515798.1 XRE family transcriptional regulator [Myroides odoratimimus]
MENNKTIEDPKQRIQMIADALGVTVNGLWPLLGYKSNTVISSIMYGKTKSITAAFAKNAIAQLPQINYLFLIDGKLPVLTHGEIQQVQQNMIAPNETISLQQIAAKLDVISKTQIKILKKLEELDKRK